MNRREFTGAAGLAAIGAAWTALAGDAEAQPANPPTPLAAAPAPPPAQAEPPPFSRQIVAAQAEQLARQPYKQTSLVPDEVGNLTYDQVRDIRSRPEKALWRGENRGFAVDLLHAGALFKEAVEIFVIVDGKALPIAFSRDLFTYGPLLQGVKMPEGKSLFSGIRIRAPINGTVHWDEVAVFQGASYFRALGQDQLYGLSARGLAIDTGEPKGEEFPAFTTYWIERPQLGAKTITVHALLDSPRCAGAYTFRITPGHSTTMEVEATLFARDDLSHLGIAPLTSMFLFDATNRRRFDDFRSAVHDSDGLVIWRSNGERIWRPLANPRMLQISAFADENPGGFGLQQRTDRYELFQDSEANYEKRPSLWVEPKVGWGRGRVELIEIPTDREINDNIAAFWVPDEPLLRGRNRSFGYWLKWGPPVAEKTLARVVQTRSGANNNNPDNRLFVVDFSLPPIVESLVPGNERLDPAADIKPEATASQGAIKNVVGRRNVAGGGYRVSFELETGAAELSELRLVLLRGDAPLSETWLYRWTSE